MSATLQLSPKRAGQQHPPWGLGEPRAGPAGARPKPLCVVAVGEFNSGKTTLVNMLLGAPVLPTSFTRHTAYPTVVRYAAKRSLSAEIARRRRVPFAWDGLDEAPSHDIYRLHIGMPLDSLRTLRAVDTPGLGLGDEVLEARTLRACRRADTVIWCTPAMQAWKASEQQTWLGMPKALRRRGVLAVTFMDALRSQNDACRLMARLHADAGDLFREIVAVSAHGIRPVLRGETVPVVAQV